MAEGGRWTGRGSLARRILAVNLLALVLLAGSLFYLDNFRVRLIDERRALAESNASIAAAAIAAAPRRERPALIATLGKRSGNRLRLYDETGEQILDSWEEGPRTYGYDRSTEEPWDTEAARVIDRLVERIVGARLPSRFIDQGIDGNRWPELRSAFAGSTVSSRVRLAPDRTLMVSAATAVNKERTLFVLSVDNARDVTRLVRAERFRLTMVSLSVLVVSIALSLFLARTIVKPLRTLALAAQRVRLGRDREVVVPRLPERSDEIGQLARAVSDMSLALRERIDATEAFAADVAHELKNPLASMASAVESLGRTNDPAITAQLRDILADDVRRLDRAISDIAELSRMDAQLSRHPFEQIDVAAMLEGIGDEWHRRDKTVSLSIKVERGLQVAGDVQRLTRAIDNLIANALSFASSDRLVRLSGSREADEILIAVEDDGPGIAVERRETIFHRFHSDRPFDGDERHSGLGLAIARTIAEGHHGSLSATDPQHGSGARFVLRLPSL